MSRHPARSLPNAEIPHWELLGLFEHLKVGNLAEARRTIGLWPSVLRRRHGPLHGDTLLEHAAFAPIEAFEMLLKRGASWRGCGQSQRRNHSKGIVTLALVRRKKPQHLEIFLRHMATPGRIAEALSDGEQGANLAHIAVAERSVECFGLLIKHAPYLLQERNRSNQTPLELLRSVLAAHGAREVPLLEQIHQMATSYLAAEAARAVLTEFQEPEQDGCDEAPGRRGRRARP